jgi:hypothetical protein
MAACGPKGDVHGGFVGIRTFCTPYGALSWMRLEGFCETIRERESSRVKIVARALLHHCDRLETKSAQP